MGYVVKPVGKPDAVVPHVRFDERGRETGLQATALVLDSTVLQLPKIFTDIIIKPLEFKNLRICCNL